MSFSRLLLGSRRLLSANETREEYLDKNCNVPFYADPLELKAPVTFIIYMIAIIWVIVGIRVVSERYFAIAIEGMIHRYKIPASIAGATLMAAGTSSPELIASTVGVFLSAENDTGSGTVIGSVIFNQLIIIGLSILVSPGMILTCGPLDIVRDVFAWAVTIGLFCWFFADGQIVLGEAWGFVIAYFAYVALCAFWTPVDRFIKNLLSLNDPSDEPKAPEEMHVSSAVHVAGSHFGPEAQIHITDLQGEQSNSAEHIEIDVDSDKDCSYVMLGADFGTDSHEAGRVNPVAQPGRISNDFSTSIPSTSQRRAGTAPRIQGSPSMVGGSPSMQSTIMLAMLSPGANHLPQEGLGFGGAMLRLSQDSAGLRSRRSSESVSTNKEPDVMRTGSVDIMRSLDIHRTSIGSNPINNPAQTYATMQHQSMYELRPVVEGMSSSTMPDLAHPSGEAIFEKPTQLHEDHDEEELSPLEEYHLVQQHGSIGGKIFFWFESLWVGLVWLTNGWLRKNEWHVTSFCVCCGWLTLFCIYLIFWLEKAGCVVGISPAVMGTVFGAAGTSLPDCLCSLYIARKGKGDMALTNVWGSNIFDILLALGLPWMLSIHVTGKPIEVTNSKGLSIIMGVLLGVFIVQAWYVKCTFGKITGGVYVGLYGLFIIYVFLNDTFEFLE